MLLDHGFDVDAPKHMCQPPLYIACSEGYADLVQLLLHRGARIARCDRGSFNVHDTFFRTIGTDNTAIATLLLDHGADIECRDWNHGQTPLLVACRRNNAQMVSMLLHRGANVFHADFDGETPLLISQGRCAALCRWRRLRRCARGVTSAARCLLLLQVEVAEAFPGGAFTGPAETGLRNANVVALREACDRRWGGM